MSKQETNPVAKFMTKPTRSQAIKAKCAECVGCTVDNTEPGFRNTIRDCTSKTCPLWSFRPYQKKTERTREVEQPGGL